MQLEVMSLKPAQAMRVAVSGATLAGLGLGLACALVDQLPYRPHLLGAAPGWLGNIAGTWLVVAWGAGALCPAPRAARLASPLLLAAAVGAYYSFIILAGTRATVPLASLLRAAGLWLLLAGLVGLVFGALGHQWRVGNARVRGLAAAVLGLSLVAESLVYMLRAAPSLGNPFFVLYALELAAGLLLPFALARRPRGLAPPMAAACLALVSLCLTACAAPAPLPAATAAPVAAAGVVSGVFDIGGRGLYLRCEGAGTPTVLLEAGLGGSSADWEPVLPSLSQATRVCVYDRAGLGQSDPPRLRPRTSQDIALDLHALLAAAGEAGPLVLVGHSMGGFHVRVYAGQFPGEVVGLVLVDASHPDQAQAFLDALPDDGTQATAQLRQGIEASFDEPGRNPEDLDVATSAAIVRGSGDLGDKPLVVVTANQAGNQSGQGVPDAVDEAFDAAWLRLQGELVGLSTRGAQVSATRGGHMVQFDEPQLVIDAVVRVVELVREGS